MAALDARQSTLARGQKRLRASNQTFDEVSEVGGLEASSGGSSIPRKRPRIEAEAGTPGFIGSIKRLAAGLWSYFLGQPATPTLARSIAINGTNMSDEDEVRVLEETTEANRRRMETIEASPPSLLVDMVRASDNEEVQLVRVVNSSKGFRNSTSLGRFYGGAYNISTKEKRDREREARKSYNIKNQLREGGAISHSNSLSRSYGLFQPSWKRQLPIDKPPLKRRHGRHENLAIYESYKLDDLAKYRSAYEQVLLCPQPSIAVLTNSMNRDSTPRRGLNDVTRSPFFPNKKPSALTPLTSGAISKIQLSPSATSTLIKHVQSRREPFPKVPEQPPLILLDHEDNEDVIPLSQKSSHAAASKTASSAAGASGSSASANDDPTNDADIIEIINLYSPPTSPKSKSTPLKTKNTLESELRVQEVYKKSFLTELLNKYDVRKKNSEQLLKEELIRVEHCKEINARVQSSVEERLRKHLTITEVAIEEPEEEEEETAELPPITAEMESVIKSAMSSGGQELVNAYSIGISRKDLETLRGLNWLNDEIINFYLQMIVERSQTNSNWPKVYATNTFFYPKLMQSGFSMLKRWTRKVDIFAHDLILIPVHLGMHWCLAVVDFKKKGIYYYDSMAGNNDRGLEAIEKYLKDEHMDKKKAPFDTSKFEKVNVKNIPKQMNGSDCGMFACKFAEYLSRNAPITFTQDDMPYFRKRMIYEIVKKTLLHP